MIKSFVLNLSYIILTQFASNLFPERISEKVKAFTVLVQWLLLGHIFGLRKDKACWFVFGFRSVISNALGLDLLVYLWNISLIYDGKTLFQYLKTIAALHDPTFYECESQFFFLNWVTRMWEQGGQSKQGWN